MLFVANGLSLTHLEGSGKQQSQTWILCKLPCVQSLPVLSLALNCIQRHMGDIHGGSCGSLLRYGRDTVICFTPALRSFGTQSYYCNQTDSG